LRFLLILGIKVKIYFLRYSDLSAILSAEALAKVEALATADHGHTSLPEKMDLLITHKFIITHWPTKIGPFIEK